MRNSEDTLLGGLRALAQTVSCEVRLPFILLSSVVLICTYNLAYFYCFPGLFVVNFFLLFLCHLFGFFFLFG